MSKRVSQATDAAPGNALTAPYARTKRGLPPASTRTTAAL
jgi:hypothetical protein